VERKDLIKIINESLIKFDMPLFNDLKSNIQEYLFKVEEEIQNILSTRKEALDIYKNRKISTNGIVKVIDVSRQTIYNNGIVDYITKRQLEVDKQDVFNILIEKNNEIQELKDSLRKMQYSNLNEQILLDKIETLEYENKGLTDQMDALNKKNIDLSAKITKLRYEYKTRFNTNVVGLNKNNSE
jgi:hypothetical protein